MFRLPYHIRHHPFIRNVKRYFLKKIIARLKWRKKMVKTHGVDWKKTLKEKSSICINPSVIPQRDKMNERYNKPNDVFLQEFFKRMCKKEVKK